MSADQLGDAIFSADSVDFTTPGACSAPLTSSASNASSAEAPRRATSRGQGFVEYALIILFVAIAVVAGLILLGPAISSIFAQLPSAL